MWKLTFCLSLISGAAFAAGLIQVPDSAVKPAPSPTPYTNSRVTPLGQLWNNSGEDYSGNMPKHLEGASQAEYEKFFNGMLETQKTEAIRMKARQIPVIPTLGVRCLDTKDAFGFERVNETEYRANCFAGTDKKITHVAEYRMKIEFVPSGCASEATIKNMFSDAAYRTRSNAGRVYGLLRKGCAVMAFPVNNLNAVTKVTPISTEFVKKTLEGNAELDRFVNGSRTSVKKEYTADEDEKPAKPKRKVVRDDDEDSSPSKPVPAPCIAGNPLCSRSAD
ncbi:MAG: hypothetical protein AB7K68_13615 [Bacteriovoracia bacterium]